MIRSLEYKAQWSIVTVLAYAVMFAAVIFGVMGWL